MQTENLNRLSITDRTFGLELEFADVDKSGVILPDGFSWSKDETFINNDGTYISANSKHGGEVNTPPLSLKHEDMQKLKFTFDELLRNGGRLSWVCSIHVHLYIGDLTLGDLKKLFALSYFTSRYIKKFSDLEEWNEEVWYVPSPVLSYYENAMSANTLEQFFNVFANSMKKGYIRHLVNVASFFRRKTVEFRSFNSTTDFEEVIGCIMFSYRYVDYALTHTVDDFKRIDSYDKFLSELKLKKSVPKHVSPLVFVGDMKVYAECMKGKDVPLTSKTMKILLDNVHSESLAIVNPNLFNAELSLYRKLKLTIYNNDEMNDIIYRICKDDLVIHYNDDKYDFIEKYNDGSILMQLVCLFLFHRLRKYTADSEYAVMELEAYIAKLDDSVERIKKTASETINLFDNCVYIHGTVNDAIRDNDNIFYQLGNNKKARSTSSILKKCSDYESNFEILPTDYYNLVQDVPSEKKFMMISKNEYLPMYKIAKNGSVIFYSNIKEDGSLIVNTIKDFKSFAVIPTDDVIEIEDYSKLKVVSVNPSDFYQLQEVYIKKVHKVTPPRFAFLVFYDKYCLGGFGFAYPKDQDYDLWLLSDFNVNNQVFRISKLILMCIQSDYVKKIIQRKLRSSIVNMYTKVYTQNPVSMKYRGIFTKEKELSRQGCLVYTSNFGTSGSFENIMNKYKSMKK